MLTEQLTTDLHEAMKASDASRRDALRFAKTALDNEAIARQHPLTDDEAKVVLARLVKQLTAAAGEYRRLGDESRAQPDVERAQLLNQYLPTGLNADELAAVIDQVIVDTKASTPTDMGKVIRAVKTTVGTRADGAIIASLVRAKLSAAVSDS